MCAHCGYTEDLINLNRICRKTHGILHTLRHLQQQQQQTENNQIGSVEPYMASPLMETLSQLVDQRNQLELLIDFYQRVRQRHTIVDSTCHAKKKGLFIYRLSRTYMRRWTMISVTLDSVSPLSSNASTISSFLSKNCRQR